MISITPEQTAFLLQYQLPSVKNEHRITSALIAAIPPPRFDPAIGPTYLGLLARIVSSVPTGSSRLSLP